jgi:hypothetical protein
MKGSFDYAPFGTVLRRYTQIQIDGTPPFFAQVTGLLTISTMSHFGDRLMGRQLVEK